MKTVLYMAMSVNGIIALDDYSEDFLLEEDWELFCDLVKEYKNIIWGSNTYTKLQSWSIDHFTKDIRDATKVIISRNPTFQVQDGYITASTPLEALNILEKEGFDKCLLTGGSTINTLFAKDGLIDEVILTIDPVMIGKGRFLFSEQDFELSLQFEKVTQLSKSRIQLCYSVFKKV